MQLSGNNLFQGFRYKRGVARNGEKERGREKGTLLPAGQLLWLRDMKSKVAGGQAFFECMNVFPTSFTDKSNACG